VDTVDCIYSPPELAEKMIAKVKHWADPSYIADFAAGDGELLKAAQEKWPQSTIIATDINNSSVALLRRTKTAWQVGLCDFLNPKSRGRSSILSSIKGKVSLVLLNPPFSCRGNTKITVDFNGTEIKCSLALAFVLTSIPFLAPDGQLVAVLPAGCLQSQKDASAWEAIRKVCRVEEVGRNGHRTFSGWSPKTVIVRLEMLPAGNKTKRKKDSRNNGHKARRRNIAVSLYRGKISMHTLNGNKTRKRVPLIHSTELEKTGLNLLRRHVSVKLKSIVGPAVLMQRVGRPNVNKILLYFNKQPIALSDCVIGIKCKTFDEAQVIKATLVRNWKKIEQKYVGTCASYITLDSLCELLHSFGFEATVDQSKSNHKN
jgi:hypothetical protein